MKREVIRRSGWWRWGGGGFAGRVFRWSGGLEETNGFRHTYACKSTNTPIDLWRFLAIKHAAAESLFKHTPGRLFHSVVVSVVVVCRFFEGIDRSR